MRRGSEGALGRGGNRLFPPTYAPGVHVFLGITGASGAPYAARLLEALTGADCEVGVCASAAAVEVLATELYGDARLSRDETLARFLEHADGGRVTLYDERDWRAPYASGSARVDAYVICPCSMGTLGALASGVMSNLIQRAGSVALKEGRRLVVMPRETPLSDIHLENMLRLRRARPRPARARALAHAPLGAGCRAVLRRRRW